MRSRHDWIQAPSSFSCSDKTSRVKSFYHRNNDSINKFLSGVDRIYVFNSTKDINDIYTRFINIVNESIKRFTSFYRVNKKPHLPRSLRNLQHFKNLLYKQTKADPFIKPLYKHLCLVYRKSISSFYLGKESAIFT